MLVEVDIRVQRFVGASVPLRPCKASVRHHRVLECLEESEQQVAVVFTAGRRRMELGKEDPKHKAVPDVEVRLHTIKGRLRHVVARNPRATKRPPQPLDCFGLMTAATQTSPFGRRFVRGCRLGHEPVEELLRRPRRRERRHMGVREREPQKVVGALLQHRQLRRACSHRNAQRRVVECVETGVHSARRHPRGGLIVLIVPRQHHNA